MFISITNPYYKCISGLKNTAEGLDDLNDLDLIPSRFDRIGEAIQNLIPDSGLRGVISARILTGAAFTDMAKGLSDRVERKPSFLLSY